MYLCRIKFKKYTKMSENNQKKRLYNGSDAYMVEQATVCKQLLADNLAAFKEFDSTLNEMFIANFEQKIDAAFTVVKDTTAITPQLEQTILIAELIKKGQDIYQDIMYFVKRKAFKSNKLKANEFGQAMYSKTKSKQADFIVFMETLNKAAIKYKPDLLAAGCQLDLIQSVEVLVDDLREQNSRQEVLKRNRPLLTSDRIDTLNECYSTLSLIFVAARQIYRRDPLKKAQFVFHPSKKTDKPAIYGDEIAGETTKIIYKSAYNENRAISIKTLDADIEFGLSEDGINFTGKTVVVSANSFIIRKMSELAPKGGYLLARNLSSETGRYEIERDR